MTTRAVVQAFRLSQVFSEPVCKQPANGSTQTEHEKTDFRPLQKFTIVQRQAIGVEMSQRIDYFIRENLYSGPVTKTGMNLRGKN